MSCSLVKDYPRLGWVGCAVECSQTKMTCCGTALTLKKEVWSSTETSAIVYRSTWYHIPENCILHQQCCDNPNFAAWLFSFHSKRTVNKSSLNNNNIQNKPVIPKQATGWTVQSSNVCTGKRSLLQNIQTGAGAHVAYYWMGTKFLSRG